MISRIDPSAPEPLFAQVATQVRLAVAAGELAPGARLPAARTLAESLALNVHTVLRADQELRDNGGGRPAPRPRSDHR
ncbi:GntR family transcriptional regulator [Sanguibacter massiliensis]|uniref:GntR family transcriptional regulator n=1 Tax=Sanguibacter massiliensis TaxID=1973217 RepID=UPI001F5DBE16|nr:GntR family transcriptional regulator [Sanguibacter massiliensis]